MFRRVFCRFLFAGLIATLTPAAILAQDAPEVGFMLSVRTVYEAPHVDATIIGELRVGDRVEVTHTHSVFYTVLGPDGLKGYVVYPKLSASPLVVGDRSPAESEQLADRERPDDQAVPTGEQATSVVITSHLIHPAKVRTAPGLFGDLLVVLPKYTEVQVMGRTKNWLLVRVDRPDGARRGYVHKAMLPANLEVPILPDDSPPTKNDIAIVQ